MGIYLNPSNSGFRKIRNGIYVDKTGLIGFVNDTIDTADNLTCFSRPRRFGKSFAAMMLAAYYDKSCDSAELFDDLKIAKTADYGTYLNSLNVIYLDITWFVSRSGSKGGDIVTGLQEAVISELRLAFPDCVEKEESYLPDALLSVSNQKHEQFFVIIDEWDALFREAKNDQNLQKSYVQLLRGLFKGGPSMKSAIAGAYMTGILPIKKYGTQSALTDFREYTMVKPGRLAEFVGFTENEVKDLCDKYDMDFDGMKQWYDGYSFKNEPSVYSPNSVMGALRDGGFGSYWTESETYTSLRDYISMNFDGLKDAVTEMLGGEKVRINARRFQNDISSLGSKDDVLTLLVHLGYLAYDITSGKVYIPNLEIAEEFQNAIEGDGWKPVADLLWQSESLLQSIIDGDAEAVANGLDLAHESCASILDYNSEAALSCAINLAYYTARKDYCLIREFPAGKGFADMVFLPRKNVPHPAMVIELKYNKDADSAIRQIKEKRYTGELSDYTGKVLLVGINYDKTTKKHTCVIE